MNSPSIPFQLSSPSENHSASHDSDAESTHAESSASGSDIQDLIQRYPFAAEASYFTRPNRYHGPASTWRSWTADERAISDAIDQERSTDLSIHLFNAFALQKRAQDFVVDGRRSVGSARETSISTTKKNDEDTPPYSFVPPRLWTAWPLRGWEVPRRDDFGSRGYTILHDDFGGTRPSTNLEEALIAITLKHTKDKWRTREAESIPTQNRREKRDWKAERDITMQQLINSGTVKPPMTPDQKSETPDAAGTPGLTEDFDEYESDTDLPQGIQTFSSQAFLAESSSSESDTPEVIPENSDYNPVLSADDDQARRLLLPSSRHVLTKLDDLLTGLHKARKAYATRNDKGGTSTSRSQSRTSSANRASSRHDAKEEEYQNIRIGTPRSLAKQQRRERERGRKRQRSPPVRSPSPPKYGLRDWSDIIGMAALTGWNTETVARAAERCARLFDENMMFRTFHDPVPLSPSASLEDTAAKEIAYDDEFAYVSLSAQINEQNIVQSDASNPVEPTTESGPRYIRSSSPCVRCKLNKIRCGPPATSLFQRLTQGQSVENGLNEPIDKTTRIVCSPCMVLSSTQKSQGNASICSGISIKLAPATPESLTATTRVSRVCPHLSCPRHTRPFKKSYDLERHLHSVHNNGNNKREVEQRPLPVRSPSKSSDTLNIRAGMELACPVPTCEKYVHNYSRPTRLYAHVRSEHPEINFLRFRALMGQKTESTRGKYDRSKTRSGSRSESNSRRDDRGRIREGRDPGDGDEEEDLDHETVIDREIENEDREMEDDNNQEEGRTEVVGADTSEAEHNRGRERTKDQFRPSTRTVQDHGLEGEYRADRSDPGDTSDESM